MTAAKTLNDPVNIPIDTAIGPKRVVVLFVWRSTKLDSIAVPECFTYPGYSSVASTSAEKDRVARVDTRLDATETTRRVAMFIILLG